MNNIKHRAVEYFKSPRNSTRDLSLTIFVTLLLAFVFSLINPNFIGKFNLVSIGQNLAPYTLLALGVLMPISMGGTDLSIGAVCIGAAVVAGKLYSMGLPLWACIFVMLLFGTLIGFINGFIIAKYRIQPFIVTLGTMMLVRGATAIFAASSTVLFPTGSWYNRLFSADNGFPVSFVWIVFFTVLIYMIYRKTRVGRYILAIGSGEQATRISGIDVDKYKIIGYTMAGFMSGVAAVFWSASFATVTVATGNGMELDAIASVYIGGTSAAGGLANVWGCLVGSLMMVVLRSGLNYSLARLNIDINSTYVTYVVTGIIVILAVLAENSKDTTAGRRKQVTADRRAIKRIALIAGSVVLCILLVLNSCGLLFANGGQADSKKLITVLMKSEGIDFWNDVAAGAKAAGDDYGYEVICRGTEGEDSSYLPKSLEIANTLLAENPAGMAMSTIASGYVDVLEEAYNRGIPVVQYDSGLYAEDLETITESGKNPLCSYVKASNYDNSALAAEETFRLVRDEIAASDQYIIGIIQHENTENAAARSGGFRDRFTELVQADSETKDKCLILTEVKPSSDNNAYKEALEFLYEKGAGLYFMTSEYVINQVADAVSAAGGKYDGMKFVGFDTGAKATEWIRENEVSPMLGTISQNPYQLGYLVAETLIQVSQGETVEEEITVPGKWICKDNIDE